MCVCVQAAFVIASVETISIMEAAGEHNASRKILRTRALCLLFTPLNSHRPGNYTTFHFCAFRVRAIHRFSVSRVGRAFVSMPCPMTNNQRMLGRKSIWRLYVFRLKCKLASARVPDVPDRKRLTHEFPKANNNILLFYSVFSSSSSSLRFGSIFLVAFAYEMALHAARRGSTAKRTFQCARFFL